MFCRISNITNGIHISHDDWGVQTYIFLSSGKTSTKLPEKTDVQCVHHHDHHLLNCLLFFLLPNLPLRLTLLLQPVDSQMGKLGICMSSCIFCSTWCSNTSPSTFRRTFPCRRSSLMQGWLEILTYSCFNFSIAGLDTSNHLHLSCSLSQALPTTGILPFSLWNFPPLQPLHDHLHPCHLLHLS